MANPPSQQQVLAVCQAIETIRKHMPTNTLGRLEWDQVTELLRSLITLRSFCGTKAALSSFKEYHLLVQRNFLQKYQVNLLQGTTHLPVVPVEVFLKDFTEAWEAYLENGAEEAPKVESGSELELALDRAAEFVQAFTGTGLAEARKNLLGAIGPQRAMIEALLKSQSSSAPAPAPEALPTPVYQRRLASAWEDVRAAINATPLTCADAAASVWVNRAVIEEIMEVLQREGYRVQNLGPDVVDKGARLLTISW